MSFGFPTNPFKLSALLVNQKATQYTECLRSLTQDSFKWVAVRLRCLQPNIEYEIGVYYSDPYTMNFYCNILLIMGSHLYFTVYFPNNTIVFHNNVLTHSLRITHNCLKKKNMYMHSSYYEDITMVHPLPGYVHKDLALGSSIMAVLHLQHCVLTILLRWVRYVLGELDRTKLPNLRSNPQIFLLSSILISTTYKNGL
jgi:hypothetical protein